MKKFYLPVFLTLITSAAFAQVYVTPTGAGAKNGTSWADAYDNNQLQTAINGAASGTQVWVAKGTYKPTESLSTTGFLTDGITAVTDRDKTFILKAGVEIYGGFAGGEAFGAAAITARNLVLNETILSGDLNSSNVADIGDAYHVVSSRNTSLGAVLDGFTIQHGFADGAASVTVGGQEVFQNVAGGIHLIGDQTGGTFRKLIVQSNQSTAFTGGVLARGADGFSFTNVQFSNNIGGGAGAGLLTYATTANVMTVNSCTFSNNKGAGDGGGALFHAGDPASNINITNCTFSINESTLFGGAFRLSNGTATIVGTSFNNSKTTQTGGKGGAIYNAAGTTLNVSSSTFNNNASASGAHYYLDGGTGIFTNTNFQNGTATGSGGAIYQIGTTSALTITNCLFDTSTGTTGGHYFISSGAGAINNSTFQNGIASSNAGAIFASGNAMSLDISSSNFYSNKATSNGGAIYNSTNLNITKSNFSSNIATGSGGAIYSTANLNATNSKFITNTANSSTNGGGAIYTNFNTNFKNCDFRSNVTAGNGGGIYVISTATAATLITVVNSYFYDNIAQRTGTTIHGGGAIYATFATANRTTVTAINNTFYANKSPNSPHGAIAYNGDLRFSLNLHNNIFNSNTASSGNSADIRKNSDAVLNFQNNLFQIAIVTPVPADLDDTFTNNVVNDAPASLFASTTATDFNFLYPTSTSIVIDQGNNALYSAIGNIATDKHLAGYDRLEGATIDMGAIEYAAILPVTISSFNAKLANGRTQLTWTVGTEDNVSRYEVERSTNGIEFIKVAEVIATNANKYNTVDGTPQVGLNYYRLKTVDNDGKFSYYGSVQSVKVNALTNSGVKVYPNPVKGTKVSVSMNGHAAGTYKYKLINGNGAIAQQGALVYDGVTDISLTTTVPAGLYVLQLNNGSVKIQTKLIKQ